MSDKSYHDGNFECIKSPKLLSMTPPEGTNLATVGGNVNTV
ncbi:hypothetical protein yinte0001_36700 [Yersinia intermedia ATCC 29909]|nr:hypothetical protein yinte0001_36700 [Yersinia intermedia ATCC 29909]